MSDADAAVLVGRTPWYHSWELRPGLVTPGTSLMHPGPCLDALGVPSNLYGTRTLDIGAWDGALTFEMERRGATAYALDIQDPTAVGFDAARRVLGSRAVHYRGSVYQLPSRELRDLDRVLFRGVYYHLKYPILAWECISASLRMGGTVHFEGEGLIHYAENLRGGPAEVDVSAFAASDVPLCLIYPNRYRASSNWHVPNAACLNGWLEAAGFEPGELSTFTLDGAQRLFGWATKVREPDIVEHPIY